MTDKTPAQHASTAAEAVRAINHATLSPLPSDGWTYPSDAYSTVGGLSRVAMMLPQALEQIGNFIEKMTEEGHLSSDRGTLQADLTDTHSGLVDASAAARQLHEALNRAHSGLSAIAYKA